MADKPDDIRNYLKGAGVSGFDLDGKDVNVTIERFQGEYTFDGKRGKTTESALWFKGKKRPLILSADCNKKAIGRLYGMDPAGWLGKRITLYPKPGVYFGEQGEAVRIRPEAPRARPAAPVEGSPETAESEPTTRGQSEPPAEEAQA